MSQTIRDEATKVFNDLQGSLDSSVFVELSNLMEDYFEGLYTHDEEGKIAFFPKV